MSDFGLRAAQAAQFVLDLLAWDHESLRPLAEREEWWRAMRDRASEVLTGFDLTNALTAITTLADGHHLDQELRERLQHAVTRFQAGVEAERQRADALHLADLPPTAGESGPRAEAKRSPLTVEELLQAISGPVTSDLAILAATLNDPRATVNDRLSSLAAAAPEFAIRATAGELAQLLRVTRQAIVKTAWWVAHRRGTRDRRVAEREERMHERRRQLD